MTGTKHTAKHTTERIAKIDEENLEHIDIHNVTSVEDINEDIADVDNGKYVKTPMQIFLNYVKYVISSALTMLYVVYIMWGIWTNEAVLPAHPIAHFLIFMFCLTLVAYLEGLQVAILAVEHNDPEGKKFSHPRAYALIKRVREGNNVNKFLVGRQFFTIFVMTLIAQVTSFPKISNLGINSVVWFIFVQTGLPAALVVTTIGSLQPQLLAAKDPWKFMDLYGTNAVMALCYGLEATGICTHFAWMLINICKATVFRLTNTDRDKAPEQSPSLGHTLCEFVKYVLSFSVIMTFFVLLMWGIWTGEAVLPVPEPIVFVIFVCCGVFLAHLEGLQVAILVAEGMDPEPFADTHPRGYRLMKLATTEKNVRRFLIGRQFLVIFVVFLINQCTIFPDIDKLGVPAGMWFAIVSLGFPTAINILCWCQLPAQILANLDPYLFMNRIFPFSTLLICLYTEMTGLAHFSWVVSAFSRATWFRIGNIGLDEVMDVKSNIEMKKPAPTEGGTNTEVLSTNPSVAV